MLYMGLLLNAAQANFAICQSSAATPSPPPTETVWSYVKIGAGGFITGIDIASDGTKVIRTDTYGGYRWDTTTRQWKQLVTMASMPPAQSGLSSTVAVCTSWS